MTPRPMHWATLKFWNELEFQYVEVVFNVAAWGVRLEDAKKAFGHAPPLVYVSEVRVM